METLGRSERGIDQRRRNAVSLDEVEADIFKGMA
jgi:hypothetical protein